MAGRIVGFFSRENPRTGKIRRIPITMGTSRKEMASGALQPFLMVRGSGQRITARLALPHVKGPHRYRLYAFTKEGNVREAGVFPNLKQARNVRDVLVTADPRLNTMILRNPIGERLRGVAEKLGGLKEFSGKLRRGFETGRIQSLYGDVQSGNPVRAATARRELLTRFPTVARELNVRGAQATRIIRPPPRIIRRTVYRVKKRGR